MSVFALDFDGVIHDHKKPIKGMRMGKPIEGADEALRKLKSRGHKIIVFSVWGDEKGKKTIEDFMKYYGLLFDEVTNIKPRADFYIDDKAVKFTKWEDVLHEVL